MGLLISSSKKARRVLMTGLAACVVFASAVVPIATTPAFAAPGVGVAGTPVPGKAGTERPVRDRGERLEKLFEREQKVLGQEANRLTKAGELAAKVQSYIDNQKAKGKDTSSLETALANFKAAVATAQSDYDTAKSTLDARAGFDANGEVTDIAQARSTVQTAGKAERQFHQTMRKATVDLRKALRQYRQANRPEAEGPKQ